VTPKEPKRADKMDVQIRYRIRADRDERIRQYRVLEKHLAGLGFVDALKDDPIHELDILDPTAERFVGTIPGDKVEAILDDVRVQNILFAPTGFVYPDAPDKPVAIKLGLRSGLLGPVQQQLHRQVVAHLAQLGFVEALGYETRGYTLVRGYIQYKSLNLLVKDLRTEPSGWFTVNTNIDKLPVPLRERNPVRWAEVLPVTEFPAPYSPPPVLPAQLRYAPDLRALLLAPPGKDVPIRAEVVFENRIDDVEALRTLVSGRYVGSSLDGVIGNVASIRFARQAVLESFALEPGVSYMRLPREGAETVGLAQAGKGTAPADALAAANLDKLRALGYTGTGVKVILIASDFTGADKLIGTDLPKRTKIVDLTTELTPELFPAKADFARLGTGTAAAKTLAAVAPDADIVLVRIDPGCFFHLHTIIKLARGEVQYTDAMRVRLNELALRSAILDREKLVAIDAYKKAFADLSDAPEAVKLRLKTKAELEALIKKEQDLTQYLNRFNAYQKEISTALTGAQVFVNTLAWESGYPLDSLSEFAQIIDLRANVLPPRVNKRPGDADAAPKPPLVWVQAAGAGGPAVWGGPFLDANRDGLMEFVQPGAKPPADNWSPQLNFLGTRAATGAVAPELAKDAKLRFVVQWREPADPNFPETDIPVHALTVRVMKQLDPTGEKRASDEMVELARSGSSPNVIFRTRTYLVFEQMLEFTVPEAGRYALALEAPARPDPLIPALRRDVEVYPRIVIETVGTPVNDPKVVFRSYTTTSAGVGAPGDARAALSVGVEADGAQVGGGTGLTLRTKPDVYGPAALTFGNDTFSGPGTATAFAGGAAVLLTQARAGAPNLFGSARIEPGKKLVLPEAWLKIVPPADKPKP
jgi:hypothetical protein